jgi:hypothetical protein
VTILLPEQRGVLESDLRTGSEWHEAVIAAGVRGFGGPPHGSPERWDWGFTAQSLARALQRSEMRARLHAGATPAQRALLLRSEM